MEISVKTNIADVLAAMEQYERDVVEKAIPRALNKIADQVKTQSARAIRDVGYKIKVSDIKRGIYVKYANASSHRAIVIASGKGIPLIRYSARQTKKGVSVDVLNGRKVINHAFIATMKSGHKGVFIRNGTTHTKFVKAGKVVWSQLPIKELFGPGIPQGMANAQVQDAMQMFIRTKFPEILRQQIKYLSS